MKKVLILQDYVPRYRIQLFEDLSAKLSRAGVRLTVAAGQPSGNQALRGDAATPEWLVKLDKREIGVFGRRLTVRRTGHLTRSADLVVVEQARRNLDIYGLMLRSDKPVVALWGHGVDHARIVSKMERRLSRWILSRANWFFAYTDGAKAAVVDQGFPSDRTTVLQNAVNTSQLRSMVDATSSDDKSRLVKKLDLRGRTALYIGALDSYKRIPMLIETAVMAYDYDPDFRLIIAGDGAQRELVMAAAHKYSYILYAGAAFDEAKARLLACADVLISPGSVGLGVLDSFAARTPMVVTTWPFHGPEREYLVSGRNAVVTDDTVEAFAGGILATLSDDALLARLQHNCATDANKYTIENMVERFSQGILRALEGPDV